jgi:hypothetical protein
VFPDGLALLHVDRERDLGLYHEPNVWVAHDAQPTRGEAAQFRSVTASPLVGSGPAA